MSSTASNPTAETAAHPAPRQSLRARTLAGGGWIAAEYGIGQILRFGSNLVLAYLLLPEAFGLMALVNVFLQGLQMFSDVGLQASVIRSRRGEDPVFLNTAWTIQVFRGVALWLAACLLAVPVSLVWEYELRYLLPVAGITAVTMGLSSTSLYVLNRRLQMEALAKLRLGSQTIGIIVMVGWAWLHPSVWALVVGSIVTHLVRWLGSYLLPAPNRHRLSWDSDAFRELFRFGRWIFLGTLLAFLAKQVDKLLLGVLFPPALLGVFWIAVQMSEFVPLLVMRLGNSVGFAALAELYRTAPERFLNRLQRVRLTLLVPANVVQLVLLLAGPPLAVWLYPDAYGDVGWILQLMIIGSLAAVLTRTYFHAFLVVGDSFRHMLCVSTLLVLTVGMAMLGYSFGGRWGLEPQVGFVVGLSIAPWLHYPIVAGLAASRGFWQPAPDAIALAACAAVVLLVLFI